MVGPAMFMVTEELIVKPLSTILGISVLNKFNIPISDLEERVVSVGEEEVKRSNIPTFTLQCLVSLAKPKGYKVELMGLLLGNVANLNAHYWKKRFSPWKFLVFIWIIRKGGEDMFMFCSMWKK